jgi:hypothetical protein
MGHDALLRKEMLIGTLVRFNVGTHGHGKAWKMWAIR